MPISSTDVPVPDDVPILDVDPYADEALADPFPLHAAVRAAGPVVFVPKYGVYFMGRHADVLPTLKDWRRFSSTSGSGIADIRRPDAWRAPSRPAPGSSDALTPAQAAWREAERAATATPRRARPPR